MKFTSLTVATGVYGMLVAVVFYNVLGAFGGFIDYLIISC